MLFHCAAALLGPVFFLQGKRVRKIIPQLPEAAGSREGSLGQGESHSILILGDSAAAGVGVAKQEHALAGCLSTNLAKDFQVHWRVQAQSGDQSVHLMEKLNATPREHFDSVIVSIGVNDVTALKSIKYWQDNLAELHQALTNKFTPQHIYLCSLPPMHLFPALPQPLRWWIGLRAMQFNQALKAFADQAAGCHYASIPYLDRGDVSHIADDGFHPGAGAYGIWADYLAELMRDRAA